jgi:hypothetical protein
MFSRIQRFGCLGLALVAGSGLLCTSASAGTPPVPPATLEYREVDWTVAHVGVRFVTQSAAFPKEPATSGKVIRGKLTIGSETNNTLSFLWAKSEGKLYLDLNRNLDFTDDNAPGLTNVFSSKAHGNSQSFSGIRCTFKSPDGPQSRVFSLDIYDYGYGNQMNGSVGLNCFFEAKVVLQGKDYRVGIIEDAELKPFWLLIQPWAAHENGFYVGGSQLEAVRFSRRLFLDTEAYQLECAYIASPDRPQYRLTINPQQPQVGELKLTGQFIERLVLEESSKDGWLVVVDQPSASFKVPVASYSAPQVSLRNGKVTATRTMPYRSPGQQQPLVTVKADKPATLTAGGPLTNTVSANQQGRVLSLAYKLIGADGAEYQLLDPQGRKTPKFAIYKGEKQIAAGEFEFG